MLTAFLILATALTFLVKLAMVAAAAVLICIGSISLFVFSASWIGSLIEWFRA